MQSAPKLSRRRLIGGLAGVSGMLAAPVLGQSGGSIDELAGQGVRIVRPGDADDFRFTIGYNSDAMLVPQVRALPQSVQAAQALFRWVREHDMAFAIRSSGHSFTGQSQHPELVIDLRDLHRVGYDRSSGLVSAQSGATMQQVHNAIGKLDLVIAGGTFYGVAMGGVATGGGLGFFARQSGLLCDQLVSIDYIDANAELRRTSLDLDPDLFWAFCGGGAGSFGLVTGFSMKALAPGPVNSISLVEVMSPEKALSAVLYWLVWSDLAPRHTTTHLMVQPYGPGKILLQLHGVAGGPREELMGLLQEVLRLDEPVYSTRVATGNVSEIQDAILPGYGWPSVKLVSRSLMFNQQMAPEAIGAMINVMLRYSHSRISTNFELLGGAVSDVASAGTAFPHRQAQFIAHFQGRASDQPEGDPVPGAVAELAETLAPFAADGTYMNYPEADLPNWAEAYWAANLPRLKQIKAKYDPENVFHHAQSVPLP